MPPPKCNLNEIASNKKHFLPKSISTKCNFNQINFKKYAQFVTTSISTKADPKCHLNELRMEIYSFRKATKCNFNKSNFKIPYQKTSVMYCTLLKYKRIVVYCTSKVPYTQLVPIEMQHAKRYRKASQGIDQLASVTWHPISSCIDNARQQERHRVETKEQLHKLLPPL